MTQAPADGLVERVAALEAERWRILRDAQQEADTMFAQYQLSQLLASGDSLIALADAVLEELARETGAAAAALWLAAPRRRGLERMAWMANVDAPAAEPPPPALADASAAGAWCAAHGWSGVVLEEQRDFGEAASTPLAVGFVGLAPPPGRALTPDHARFLALVRHELAISFRAAQLRETLDHERATLEAILEGASDAIVAVDADRRVVRLNGATARLTGRTAGAAAGQPCREVLGCDDPHPASPGAALLCGAGCPFAEVIAGGSSIADREVAIRGPDGRPIPVAGSYAPMPGPAAGAVAVLRDLRPARELDQLKASFVAAVSHELRTPLALISGYAQSLEHLDLGEPTRRTYVERIGRTTERLGRLVDQILEIARIDGDELTLELRPVSLPSIVRRIARELSAAPVAGDVRVTTERDLPAVRADEARVGQVVANLIDNAIKYGPAGAPVRVRVERSAERPELVVHVVDAGPGIDPDERAQVFERFFRGHRVRESSRPGNGLGLYLCRRLVEAQEGRIWLDDVPRGTSVAFSLPLVGR